MYDYKFEIMVDLVKSQLHSDFLEVSKCNFWKIAVAHCDFIKFIASSNTHRLLLSFYLTYNGFRNVSYLSFHKAACTAVYSNLFIQSIIMVTHFLGFFICVS